MKNVLQVIGCYAPNFAFKPVSMYKIFLGKKIVYLDIGYGNGFKIDVNNLENTIIVISHNHIDHAAGLLEFAVSLRLKGVKLKKRIPVYIPDNTFAIRLSRIYPKQSKYFDFTYINESTEVNISNYKITFCKTIHKGESYAIKIKKDVESFVYTSDLSRVTKELIEFCKGTNLVIIEGGRPIEKPCLKNYHASTEHLIKNITKSKAGKILISHLKISGENAKAYDKYCKKNKIEIIKLKKKYCLFKG